MTAAADAPSRPTGSAAVLVHRPGLDGVRGLAVAAVVAYHLGYGWAGGGFLGVSLFFTLSGYLVTSVLLADHAEHGRVSLRGFWARRARRILPASLVTLAGVVLLAAFLPTAPGLAGDVRAALAQVANWRFVFAHRSYADRFSDPSPLQHLWSLAIEEQLYVVLPLVAVVSLRRGRRTLAWVLAGLTLASVLVGVVLRDATFDRVYQGTDARAAELLLGALAACLVPPARRAAAPLLARSHAGGALALAALVALWGATRLDDRWLRLGGLGAVALVHTGVVLAAAGPAGARWFGARPLVALGRISYGVYLYHWPLVVWLTTDRTGLAWWVVDALRVVGSLGLAALSYRFVETPVRRGALGPRVSRRLACYAFAGTLVASLLVPAAEPAGAAGLLSRYHAAALPTTTVGTVPAPTTVPSPATPGSAPAPATTVAPAPPRAHVWLVGDSIPYSLAPAFATAARARGMDSVNLAVPGCDGARGWPTTRLGFGLEDTETRVECLAWETRWPQWAAALPPDVVVLVLGGNVTLDRRIDGAWQGPCDAEFRAWYEPEVLARVDWVLANTAARPVLTLSPWAEDSVIGVLPRDHRVRTDCVNDVLRSVAVQRSAVRLVDLQSFVCPAGEAEPCQPWRRDGLHFEGDGATTVAGWLADQALAGAPAPT